MTCQKCGGRTFYREQDDWERKCISCGEPALRVRFSSDAPKASGKRQQKLSDDDFDAIWGATRGEKQRGLYARLATEYGVSAQYIGRIAGGLERKHIWETP